jgi:hypothetical protein
MYHRFSSRFKQNGLPMISSINTNFCIIFGGLEDQVCNLKKGEKFPSVESTTDGRSIPPSRIVRACRCLHVVRAEKPRHAPLSGPTNPAISPAPLPHPSTPLPTSSHLELLSLVFSSTQAMEETTYPPTKSTTPHRSSSENHYRMSPTSFSTTPSTYSSP